MSIHFETAEEIVLQHAAKLTEIVEAQGDFLEGNLFYTNLEEARRLKPLESLAAKRRNLVELIQNREYALEIGFNAGHSALLMLVANPTLKLDIVDRCDYGYARPCFEYLNREFPRRMQFIEGDSLEILPLSGTQKYDLIHFDGGKHFTIEQDLRNTRDSVKDQHVLLVDDTQGARLLQILNRLAQSKFIDLDCFRHIADNTANSKWRHAAARFL